MNDYIYSSYFPSSIFAGTVLQPGFAGPLLHAPSSCSQIVSTSTICRRLAIIPAPSSYPERQFPRDTISSVQSVPLEPNGFAGTPFPPFNPFRWNRTAPVDDQLPPRRSPQRRFIVPPVLRQFFHIFFVIPSASRSDRDLSLFSFSFAPYPVLRSLRLSLTGWYRDHSLFTCLVLFPFVPLYGREPSHTDHHPSFTTDQSSFVRYRDSSI